MTPIANPSLVALFFQLRDFCAGGAVERKRRAGKERRVGIGARKWQRGICLIILEIGMKKIEETRSYRNI